MRLIFCNKHLYILLWRYLSFPLSFFFKPFYRVHSQGKENKIQISSMQENRQWQSSQDLATLPVMNHLPWLEGELTISKGGNIDLQFGEGGRGVGEGGGGCYQVLHSQNYFGCTLYPFLGLRQVNFTFAPVTLKLAVTDFVYSQILIRASMSNFYLLPTD